MKLVGVLASFNDATYYQNYEDKDRHTALTAKVDAQGVQAKIHAIMPPKPKKLPKLPSKPCNAAAEQFINEAKLGSTFLELEVSFAEKRELVQRVLEADTNLEKDLSELDARALLHRTAQEVAANMGLRLTLAARCGADLTNDHHHADH